MEGIEKPLISILISGNSFTLIFFGLGQLAAKNKAVRHYLAAAVLIVAGLNMLVDTAFRTGISYRLPYLLYANYPLEYLMGPLLYLFLLSLVYRKHTVTGPEKLLFLPPAAVALLMLPYYLQTGAVKQEHIPFHKGYHGVLGTLYRIIDRGIEVWLLFCLGLFLLQMVPSFFQRNHTRNNRLKLVLVYGSLWLVWTGWYALVVLLPIESLYSLTVMVGSFLALGFFFFYMRNPDFLKRVVPSLVAATHLEFSNEASVQRILAKLDHLMEKEELYLDENLNLSNLAARLDIQAYRLSEILNRKLNTSFKPYINNHRLDKARDLLIREPETSILDIAFRSGFRSKSAFNGIFKENTGITPRDYRRSKVKAR